MNKLILQSKGKKENIDISIFDDKDSILKTIAEKFDTLPEYIILEPSFSTQIYNYKVITLEDEFKGLNFEQLYSKIIELKEKFSISDKDFIFYWILINKNIEDYQKFKKIFELFDESNIRNNLNKKLFQRNYEEFINNFETSKEILSNNNKKYQKTINNIKNIKNYDKIGKFNLEKISLQYNIILPNGENLLNIFDNFQTSEEVPFIYISYETSKMFYKVYDKFNIPYEWLQEVSNQKISVIKGKIKKDEKYIDFTWNKDNNIHANLDISKDVENLEEVEKIFFEKISKNIKNIKMIKQNVDQLDVHGFFNFVMDSYNRIYFTDLIFRNKIVSNVLFLDELLESSSKKIETFQIYFWPYDSFKEVERSLSARLTIQEGSIRVKIQKSRSMENVLHFIEYFKKILTLYIDNYDSIKSKYSIFEKINKPKKEKIVYKKALGKLGLLQEKDKDLFGNALYARLVQEDARKPTIIEKKDLKDYDEEEVLNYPTGSDRYYICNDDKYKYPTLKKTTYDNYTLKKLENKPDIKKETDRWIEKHKYVPICAIKEKSTNKVYKEYLSGKTSKVEEKVYATIGSKTNLMIKESSKSKLPLNLEKIFGSDYVRYGVKNSKDSILYCMEYALYQNKDIKDVKRKLTRNKDSLNIAKQEMYDFSIDDISNYINGDNFLDLQYIVKILENYYKCNIFMYSTRPNPNGDVLLPRHINNYYMRQPSYSKSISIIRYENTGFEFPYQYELIMNLKGDCILSEELEQKNFKILEEFNNLNILKDGKLVPLSIPPYYDLNIISQGLNSEGKVYMLNVEIGKNIVSLFIDICAPYPVIEDNKIYKLKKDIFVKDQIEGISENKEILFLKNIGNIPKCYAFTSKDYEINNLKIINRDYIPLADEKNSKLNYMIRNKKIANYLKEYVLFLYSKNLKITKNNFIVVKNHIYDLENIQNKFNLDDGIITKDGKIIVLSDEMIYRLIYYCESRILINKNLIVDYKDKEFIPKNYENVSDFKQNPNQLIFTSLYDVLYWITDIQKSQNIISNIFHPNIEDFYYFSSYKIFGGKICIIQNVLEGDLERALNVSKIWHSEKINIGFYSKKISSKVDYNLFQTNGDEESTSKDSSKNYNQNILQYGNNNYAAILFL